MAAVAYLVARLFTVTGLGPVQYVPRIMSGPEGSSIKGALHMCCRKYRGLAI